MSEKNLTSQDQDEMDHPVAIAWLMKSWSSVLALVHHIITETADQGVDIAARALALSAPLPNAVSIYNISQIEMGFNWWQALAFAATLELSLFALVEIALKMWDGYLGDQLKYKVPLVAAIIASLGVLAIVVRVVYTVEIANGGHEAMALLPFISLCAFIGIGLKRWDARQPAISQIKPKKKQTEKGNYAEISTTHSLSPVEIMNAAKTEKIRKRQTEIRNIVIENSPISVSDITKLLSFQVSAKTVANDLEEIAKDGEIEKVGSKWRKKETAQIEVIKAVFSTNGMGHHV